MTQDFREAEKEIAANRQMIIDKLLIFAMTDALLFWGHNDALAKRQEKQWTTIIVWAAKFLEVNLDKTDDLEVKESNHKFVDKLKPLLEGYSDKKLTAFYLLALNMHSVILAMALVEAEINVEEAYKAAWLEELWQAETWGIDEESEHRRLKMKVELQECVEWLKTST